MAKISDITFEFKLDKYQFQYKDWMESYVRTVQREFDKRVTQKIIDEINNNPHYSYPKESYFKYTTLSGSTIGLAEFSKKETILFEET